MNLRDIFIEYEDTYEAFNHVPVGKFQEYKYHIVAYRQFIQYTSKMMFDTLEAMHDAYGVRMNHEIEYFIKNNDKLTDDEREMFFAFSRGDNREYERHVKQLFLGFYEFTSQNV